MSRKTSSSNHQISLFAAPPPEPKCKAAPPTAAQRVAATRLPPGLRMGTSSWSFPGWSEIVYAQRYSPELLARHGLSAYAQHPLLRAVGVDRSHYGPPDEPTWRDMAAQVPDDFRFVVKAHELCSLAVIPDHDRYGKRRGQPNALFLDAAYAAEAVVGPTVAGLGPKLGTILFQFAPQPVESLGGLDGFTDRLYTFLSHLPPGPSYAVELRNGALIRARYAEALQASGASHCYNAIGGVPPIPEQLRRVPPGPRTLIRWMLRRELRYEDAVSQFSPFDRLAAPDAQTRAEIVAAILAAAGEVTVIVNNKAEGSSPLSIFALAEALGGAV